MRAAILLVLLAASRLIGANAVEQELLAAHNAARKTVGVPDLRWSPELAAYAAEWARTLADRGQFEHRPQNRYGENLYMMTGGTATPAQVVANWAGERKNYDIRTNKCNGVCGHYTQIVWRDTTAVGCAKAQRGRREIWVCNYDPPGNWRGQKPY